MSDSLSDSCLISLAGALKQPTVLVTTVDIGNGKSDRIEIRRGDDPADLALAFCQLHSLPEGVLGPLTEHLLDNLRKASKSLSASQVSQHGRALGTESPIMCIAKIKCANCFILFPLP